MKNFIKKFNEKTILIYTFIFTFFVLNTRKVFATDLASSPFIKGTLKLISDATLVLIGVSTGVAVLMIIILQLKKNVSDDEMEAKQYDKKTKAVIVSYIIILCAASIIALASYYYGKGSAV